MFSRDKTKKKEKVAASREELSKTRYDCRGSRDNLDANKREQQTVSARLQ